jgi:hypothetical protein
MGQKPAMQINMKMSVWESVHICFRVGFVDGGRTDLPVFEGLPYVFHVEVVGEMAAVDV